jgi:uncharacterized protein
MKLDAAPARRDGPRDNRFESARPGQNPNRGGNYGGQSRAPQPAASTAMESAFSKLAALKK